MPSTRDVVIIGAGHNALVTAFYLGRAGLHPLVLEQRPVAGGAAATDEFTRDSGSRPTRTPRRRSVRESCRT